MRIFKLIICITFLFFQSFLIAQTNIFSLEKAIDYGLENNRDLKNIVLESEKLREQAFEVMTEGFPKISANIDYNHFFKQQVSIIPAGIFGPTEQEIILTLPHSVVMQAEINQLVFDARYIYGMKARKGFFAQADARTELGIIDAKDKITKAYYQALVANESYKQLAENENILNSLLKETTKTYEEGLTDELAVNRLELNLSNLLTQIERARQQYENALLNLKFVIAMPQSETLELSETLDDLFDKLDWGIDKSINPESRIETKILMVNDEMRMYDIKEARSNYFPSFYAFGNYGTLAQRSQFNFFNDGRWFDFGGVGFRINVPIFDGLQARSQVQQRKIQREQNFNDLENFKESIQLEVAVAKNNLNNAINEYNTQIENVELAQKILKKTIAMFSEGVGSSFELSQAQQDLTTTQINYAQSVYNLLVAQVELKKSLGKL